MTPDSFLAYLKYERRASDHTITAYQTDLAQFQDFCANQFEIFDITLVQPFMIREWMASLKSSGLENRSINRKKSSVSAFYKYCQQCDASLQNPARLLKSLKTSTRTASFVPEGDMKRHRAPETSDFEPLRNHLIIEFLYQTGLRRAELLSLTQSNFDLSRQMIKFTGKGNKQRIVPLPPDLINRISNYIQLKEKLFPGVAHFLVSARGKPMPASTLHKIVAEGLGAITTLTKRSPHVLRHTYATHLVNNGAPLIAVKELLGHSSLAATEIYVHNSIAQLKKIHQQAHPKG
ncbi:MAG: tyrosine-type recombinase/integrase [Bacteroidetes bacterium]|nr:tyrosine-type recombinase/integrase [Bacteroidota bacterium]